MNITKDILNRISNGIKRAFVSLVGSDSEAFQTTQISYLGKTADTEVIYPYGLCGNPPSGSITLMFNVQGQEENRAGIANLPNRRFKNLKAGEVAVGNYLTTSVIKFLENGNIEVFCQNNEVVTITHDASITIGGSATVNISGTATVNCPTTTINGDVNINGNLNVVGDSFSTGNTSIDGSLSSSGDVTAGTISLRGHVHGGVLNGGGSTNVPTP